MGKPRVSRFVTVGFDREGDADKFLQMVEGNGLLVQLYKRIQDEEGNPKGQVTRIQARSAHVWTPSSWERRRFEFGGVTLEFKDQLIANEFLSYVMRFLSGELVAADNGEGIEDEEQTQQNWEDTARALAMLLKPENVFGAKIERD